VDAFHDHFFSSHYLMQRYFLPAGTGPLPRYAISMRAGAGMAQQFGQFFFDLGRNRVFQTMRFLMGFDPIHTQDIGQQPFGKKMAPEDSFSDLFSFGREVYLLSTLDREIALAL
jgi:hypothetical protein